MSRIAIDIGGTNMRVATCTATGIGPIARMRTPLDPDDALQELASLMHGSIEGIVCGLAAVIEGDRVVAATNLPTWNGFPLGAELARRTRAHVVLVNDAELAGLGEAVYGAGKDAVSVAYLGIGTGVGTSRILAGSIEAHSSDSVARTSIITLSDGRTLEETIGGHALQKQYGCKPEDIPRATWKELTPILVEGVFNLIALWSPDVVVLGGSLVNDDNGFKVEDVAREIRKKKKITTTIRKSELGDAAGLNGARALLCE